MLLSEIIINKIKEEGPVSFHDFMEMSLYYPQLGYYSSHQNRIGKDGDYFTSSSISPLFGAMIGKQLEEMWSVLGEKQFTIVEYGAGHGNLSLDILNYLKGNEKLYDDLNYCIIEKSESMRAKEKNRLQEKVKWHDSIQEIPEINGCVISNELVDNFSVHQVVMQDELMEVFVDYKNDFVEVLRPASKMLADYLAELKVVLPKGFRTEINLEATHWIKEIACCLKSGYVITIDYGYPSSELYRPYRREGTLLCYHKHQVNDHPYHAIGEQDITSHVNFTALNHWGQKNGLDFCGLTDQAHFLLALGFAKSLEKKEEHVHDIYAYYKERIFQINNLLMKMGSKLKVLIQGKDIPPHSLLGLQFS